MKHPKEFLRSEIFLGACFVSIGLNLRPSLSSIGPLSNTLQQTLSIRYADLSLLISIPTFFMGIFALLISYFRPVNNMRLCMFSISCIGIATLSRFFADNFPLLVVTAIICGFGIAIAQSVTPGIIKTISTPSVITKQMTRFSASIMAGAGLAAASSPFIADLSNNWSFALSLWGVLAIPCLMILTSLSNSKPAHEAPKRKEISPLKPDRTALLLALYFGLCTSLFTAMLTWLPAIYIDIGWTNQDAGRLMAYFIFAEVLGGLYLPRLYLTRDDRRFACWLSLALVLVGLIGLIFIPAQHALLWVGLLGLGIGALFPLTLLLPLDRSQNLKNSHSLVPFVQGAGYLIASLSPYLIGLTRQNFNDFNGGLWALVILTILLTILTGKFTLKYLSIER